MTFSEKKRPRRYKSNSISDDDDSDDDDDLLTSVFGSNRSSRKSAKDEVAKKKRRMAQMNALLDSGKIKLERENRMDKLCRENNELLRDDDVLDRKKNDESDDVGSNFSPHAKNENGNGPSSTQQDKNYYQNDYPRDVKETSELGSRGTMQFSRVIYRQRTCETLTAGADSKRQLNFTSFWYGMEEALRDLRSLLSRDRDKQQGPSSFNSLRDKLLESCKDKSPRSCLSYLRKSLTCKEANEERIRHIPVNLLRWLMALACGPIAIKHVNSGERDYENSATKRNTQQAARLPKKDTYSCKMADLLTLREAQIGAYQTLYRLWSQDLGFPLQQEQDQNEFYLMSISALPLQLNQWFGLSLTFDRVGGGDKNNDEENKRNGSVLMPSVSTSHSTLPTTNSASESNRDLLYLTSTRTKLIHFLQLWALCLQKQNGTNPKNKSYLVHFHCDKCNCAEFRNEVSKAIMTVLWAGLDPSFASSNSAQNDGNRSIQTIIACLLERVRQECLQNNHGNDNVDGIESFGQWLQNLSEQICTIWSKHLGRGQKETDAYDDKHAWLCLARSVSRLVDVGDDNFERVGNFGGEKRLVYPLKDFQFSLCRCILKRAFGSHEEGHKPHNVQEYQAEKEDNGKEVAADWVSSSIDEEMQRMEVPLEIRSSKRWQAMAFSIVGLAKLGSFFPEEEACKCFALMDIFTVCFRLAVVELEKRVKKKCFKQRKRVFDENEYDHTMHTNTGTMALRSIEVAMLEKQALYNAFERLEILSEIVSNKTRVLIMQNICFPWASHMAESLRNYARSQKNQYAPQSKGAPMNRQSMISNFFSSSTK